MTDAALRAISTIILILASIIALEVGVVPCAGYDVGLVALNRQAAGYELTQGWHAYRPEYEPPGWAIDAAWQALWTGGDADGDLFALSEEDMRALGFDKANWENVGSEEWPEWIGRILE